MLGIVKYYFEEFQKDLDEHFPNIAHDSGCEKGWPLSSNVSMHKIAEFSGYDNHNNNRDILTYENFMKYLLKNKHLYEWWKL